MNVKLENEQPLLEIDQLTLTFEQEADSIVALRDISISMKQGEILGLVGESGSGKSLTALSLMKLLPANARFESGDIRLDGVSIKNASEAVMRKYRGNHISMIFQEPMTALNPLVTVGKQIEELFVLHKKLGKADRKQKVLELLSAVGINEPEIRYKQFPFELSGGMRQRIMIAMALACDPKVIIADEPTTALDVTIQAQILDLLKEIKESYGTSILLITHDMGVIADIADRVAVMYAGQMMELASVDELLSRPHHPYTNGLLNSIPDLTHDLEGELNTIRGTVPDLKGLPKGCPFHPRCDYATDRCKQEQPKLENIASDHLIACWHPLKDMLPR